MNYCCDSCGFLFFRRGAVQTCPSCESDRIRPATDAEAERLQELLRTIRPDALAEE